MESRWTVKKDGKAVCSGPMDTLPPAEQIRSMAEAGYKTYVDGKIYKPKKGEK